MSGLDIAVIALLALAVAAHLAAFVLFFTSGRRAGLTAFSAGWAVLAVLFALNWLAAGEPPFGNMYHVLAAVGLCFLPACLLLGWKDGLRWPAPAFALAAATPLVGALFVNREIAWQRMPALQSAWFVPHVATYTFSYCLAGAAFAVLLAGAAKEVWRDARARPARSEGGPKSGGGAESEFARFADAAYLIARFSFPFMTFGLCSGALWAEEAWGAYWSWDSKETWSLATWTLYAIALHCHIRPALRPYAPWAQGLGFAALLVTFLGVNYLSSLGSMLHSYT